MTAKYYAILTNQGAAKLAAATARGTQIHITQMAVGDGNGSLPTPDATQTQLLNQKRIGAVNTLTVDAANANQIIAEQVIPENEGGYWIREMGLFDDDGVLIAIANCPETYKPLLQEGSGRTQTIRMALIVSSTAAVTLKIDPSVVLATRKYVDDLLDNHIKVVNPHSQYLQTTLAFKEIASSGSTTVAAALKNLGLGEAAKRAVGTGENQIPDMSAFQTGSTTTGHWVRFPNGWLMQSGILSNTSTTAGIDILFPVQFTVVPSISLTSTASVSINSNYTGADTSRIYGIRTFNSAGAAQMNGVSWLATGF